MGCGITRLWAEEIGWRFSLADLKLLRGAFFSTGLHRTPMHWIHVLSPFHNINLFTIIYIYIDISKSKYIYV